MLTCRLSVAHLGTHAALLHDLPLHSALTSSFIFSCAATLGLMCLINAANAVWARGHSLSAATGGRPSESCHVVLWLCRQQWEL